MIISHGEILTFLMKYISMEIISKHTENILQFSHYYFYLYVCFHTIVFGMYSLCENSHGCICFIYFLRKKNLYKKSSHRFESTKWSICIRIIDDCSSSSYRKALIEWKLTNSPMMGHRSYAQYYDCPINCNTREQ